MSGSILLPVRATFRAVAVTVVPEASSLGPDAWAEMERVVEQSLAARPASMQRQLITFLRVIEYMPLLRYLRRFTSLSPERRLIVLTGLQNSGRLLFRRGFWGLRTLIYLGYYTRDDVQGALGYRAHRNGWSARRITGEMRAVVSGEIGAAASGGMGAAAFGGMGADASSEMGADASGDPSPRDVG